MDKIDQRILLALQTNARASLQEIGEQVGLSNSPCWARIKRMEEAGIIEGYTVRLNAEQLGLHDTVLIQVTLDSHSDNTLEKFGETLAQIPEVVEAYLVSGDYDYLLKVVVSGTKDYERLLRDKLYKIKGIRHSRSSFVLRTLKHADLPLAVEPLVVASTKSKKSQKPARFVSLLALSFAFTLLWFTRLPIAQAQVPPKTVADSIAEKVQACIVCHGKEGRATNDGFFPRIAGKPVDYLFNQLKNFRDGRRSQSHMNYLVGQLPDTYLKDMAVYFSNLDLPYPPPQIATLSADNLQRGQVLVLRGDPTKKIAACITCHGQSMMGMRDASPSLLGLPRDYLVAQLGAWQTGSRKATAPDCMGAVAKQLNPTDIAAVTHWLAAQPVVQTKLQTPSLEALQCGSFK